METKNLAPIILFVFNRPEHTKETIEALKKNDLAKESILYIFSDGARNNAEQPKVTAVREFLKTITGFKEIHISENPMNQGLPKSIIGGASAIIAKYGRAIIMEDDVITAPQFLHFMNDALLEYKDDERIMHISGYFFRHNEKLPEYFLTRQMLCWGWATWDRAWKHFTPDIDTHIAFIEKHKELGSNHFLRSTLSMLRANKRGTLRTWSSFWQCSILENGGLCLTPSISFVKNIGNDESGTNSKKTIAFETIAESTYAQQLPKDVQLSELAESIGSRAIGASRPPLIRMVYTRMKQLLTKQFK